MKLYVITTPTFFVEEHNIINALFEEGLDGLHLRKPDSQPIYSERLLRLIDHRWHKRIVVHDHFYLKSEFSLRGIHLNRRNPEPPRNYRGQLTRSCHSISELREWKPRLAYAFLSPIYDSISKTGYASAFSTQTLEMAAEDGTIDSKVVALGGIDTANITQVRNIGFGGAALMGTLWNRFDNHSSSSYSDLIKHFHTLRKLAD